MWLSFEADACVKRWTALRDRYVRESHRYTPSGSGSSEANKWHLYEAMTFLESHVTPRK